MTIIVAFGIFIIGGIACYLIGFLVYSFKSRNGTLCPTCHGKGQIEDGDSMPCPTCKEKR